MPEPRSATAVSALLLACVLLPSAEASAQAGQKSPQRIGDFQSWTAVTQAEGGQKVCYAFTRATRSEGVPNRGANNVLLVVTHRPEGRDQVALQSGYAYPRNADAGNPVQVSVGGRNIGFFTDGSSAFARDGKAAVAALRNGREAVARGPGPHSRGQASDTFSLAGFAAAHDAISRECPARASAPGPAAAPRR
jgi:hypothetical protein